MTAAIRHFSGLFLLGFSLTAFAQTPAPVQQSEFEIAPMFESSQLLAPELRMGPHFRVRELAPSDGYLVHFTVDSDYGTFECVGYRELQRRITEIGAIAELVRISKTDLFAKGVRQSIESPIAAAKNIVTQPGQTVAQLPQTVGHFFSQVGSSVGGAVRKAGENDSGGEDREDVTRKKSLTRSLAGVAGFDKAMRETARQLGVDPYTDNLRLQEEMEKVTWPFFAGGLPLKVGVKVASSGASLALTATGIVGTPDAIYSMSPAELALQDRKSMEALGVDQATADSVINNTALSISKRHTMIAILSKLNPAPGRESIVKLLSITHTARQAHYLSDVLQLMLYRNQTQPYAGYGVYGNLPGALTADQVMEISAPVDYISWTEAMQVFALRPDWGAVKKRLILSGTLSPVAQEKTVAAGWEVIKVDQQ